MKRFKPFFSRAVKIEKGQGIRNEKGQGTAEYVLLLVVVVALVFLFKDKIKGALEGKLNDLGGKIETFSGE